MPRYVAAIDQGTTSSRCMIFDEEGCVAAAHQVEHRQIFPRPGWVEHDPVEIRERVDESIRGALARAKIGPGSLAAAGITNQRETTLVWDRRDGRPLSNAIVWQDTRTDGICGDLARDGGQDRFRPVTGLPLSTYFSGPKLKWMLDNVDGLRATAENGNALFGTVDSWVIWNLTGGPDGGIHATDVTNASRTQLMNLSSLEWDQEILDTLEIPPGMLPRICPSSDAESFGRTRPDGPFGASIPIGGVLGDQQAALFGQACFATGEAKNTYGTGCFMLLNTGTECVPSTCGLLTTVGYRIADQPTVFALEGSVAIAGALVQWLRDNLGLIEHASEIESLAQSVDDSGGAYFVPAFSGLFAPHWRQDARGVIVGLTRYVNRGHIARAALEATAFQTREVLDAMRADTGLQFDALKVDGGMVVNETLMQFQADLLGLPVVRPVVSETTALGAAYAAGLAVGLWPDQETLRSHWKAERRWEPAMSAAEREERHRGWLKAVNRTLDWVDSQP